MSASLFPPPVPSPRSLAELALAGAVAGRSAWIEQPLPLEAILRDSWSAGRLLQRDWFQQLARLNRDLSRDTVRFETIALEVFLAELVFRVWGTNWAISDRAQGSRDAERILRHTLDGFALIRRDVLLQMVHSWSGATAELVSRIDRFRRRCERWTDLLIAGPASMHEVWDFAVDRERSRDFGRDSWKHETGPANPVSLLVSAGLRVMFGVAWPADCCRSEPFAGLMNAVYATLPESAFDEFGALRPACDWPRT